MEIRITKLDPKKAKFGALDLVARTAILLLICIRMEHLSFFPVFIKLLLSVGEFSFCNQFDTCERILGYFDINRNYFEMDTFHRFNSIFRIDDKFDCSGLFLPMKNTELVKRGGIMRK